MTEAGSRVIIDSLLSEVGWILRDSDGNRNVDFEVTNEAGRLDYLLRDSNGFPLCILEAKSELKDPLDGKEQARNYADQEGCRFIILSNGFHHWINAKSVRICNFDDFLKLAMPRNDMFYNEFWKFLLQTNIYICSGKQQVL